MKRCGLVQYLLNAAIYHISVDQPLKGPIGLADRNSRKRIFLQNIVLSPNYRSPSVYFLCIRTSCISEPGGCLRRGSDKRGSSVICCAIYATVTYGYVVLHHDWYICVGLL